MRRPCGGREYDLREYSNEGLRGRSGGRAKAVGRSWWGLKELRPCLMSKADTQGRTGGGQEGIQFHSVGCGTQETSKEEGFRTSGSCRNAAPGRQLGSVMGVPRQLLAAWQAVLPGLSG